MRRCFETDCRVVLKLSAIALGVIACKAIKAMIARLVGSAIAWKMSRLMSFRFSFKKPFGCKYKCNYSVAQIIYEYCRIYPIKCQFPPYLTKRGSIVL